MVLKKKGVVELCSPRGVYGGHYLGVDVRTCMDGQKQCCVESNRHLVLYLGMLAI